MATLNLAPNMCPDWFRGAILDLDLLLVWQLRDQLLLNQEASLSYIRRNARDAELSEIGERRPKVDNWVVDSLAGTGRSPTRSGSR